MFIYITQPWEDTQRVTVNAKDRETFQYTICAFESVKFYIVYISYLFKNLKEVYFLNDIPIWSSL